MRLRVHNKKKEITRVRKSQRTMRQENKENYETGVEIEIVNDTGVRGNRSGSVRQETRGESCKIGETDRRRGYEAQGGIRSLKWKQWR